MTCNIRECNEIEILRDDNINLYLSAFLTLHFIIHSNPINNPLHLLFGKKREKIYNAFLFPVKI